MKIKFKELPFGRCSIEAQDFENQILLNKLSRSLYGYGQCANAIYNSGPGGTLIFQYADGMNKKRAKILVSFFQFLLKNKVEINLRTFPQRETILSEIPDLKTLKKQQNEIANF